MSEETYNGWTNRETWAVFLHINNDQGWQESVLEELRSELATVVEQDSEEGIESTDDLSTATKVHHAANVVRENVEEALDPFGPFGHGDSSGRVELTRGQWLALQDIGSMWRVNWTELGASFLADLETN